MTTRSIRELLGATALVSVLVASPLSAVHAQSQESAQAAGDPAAAAPAEEIVVTGSRIPRADLTSTSPVALTSQEQIRLDRAQTVEDFSVKLPQLAGGVNSTSVGSDAYGAQTLDLRNFGQNRTLVLINGTRAVPFSFRNSVDINSIPAPLLERVDVLTGGAAAVYGADAVAGVVNFIIDTDFEGLQAGGTYEFAEDGGSQYGGYVQAGGAVNDRGNIVAYVGYTRREALFAGDRAFALANPTLLAPAGGNFTDVASGRRFSFDANGAFTTTPQTTDYTPQYFLIQPLERWNASTFFNYDVLDTVELYGRAMYTNVQSTGAPRAGQQPIVIDEVVTITSNNPFLPAEARNLLTFNNGAAQVRVNRSLGELGVQTAATERNTYQGQVGLRGPVTEAVNWDTYFQYGRTSERTTVNGDAIRNTATGASRFAAIANTVDIFGPGADLAGFGQSVQRDIREREQLVAAATLSGNFSDVFELPAGPVGFALGYEYRKETGKIRQDAALAQGLTFRQGTELPVDGEFDTNEVYGELLIPVLRDLPFMQKFDLEAAYRISDYSNAGSFDTSKIGASWEVSDDIRFRGSRQKVIRAPNIGEFAAPTSSIPFSSLVTVARLRPRYAGDPCVLGTGNAEQCTRQGFRGNYNSLDAANLRGNYFFGGNPDIKPEKGTTWTVGAVATPRFLPGFSLTVDYYNIKLEDAVGQIQPIDALTSCYITNPTADNPLCAAVTRDPATGFILNGFPIDRNLGTIKQQGLDIGASYRIDLADRLPGDTLTLQYQGNVVTDYTIQRNEVLTPIDCKGTYGFTCSSDAVSLVQADYRHRASANWAFERVSAQLGWVRIGDIRDSALGSTDKIKAFNYIDAAISVEPLDGVQLVVGVDNLFDKKPPRPRNFGTFNTYPDTYNVIGRTVGVSLTVTR